MEGLMRWMYQNAGFVWAFFGVVLFLFFFVWPRFEEWRNERRSIKKDPLAEERIRVARLKQMDAYRDASKTVFVK